MTKRPTYSLLLTPGRQEIRVTLLESVWHPHGGLIPRELASAWVPWTNWQPTARRLLAMAVAYAGNELQLELPGLEDTPKASASPGGS